MMWLLAAPVYWYSEFWYLSWLLWQTADELSTFGILSPVHLFGSPLMKLQAFEPSAIQVGVNLNGVEERY